MSTQSKTLTFGQKLVGVNFNPSSNPDVDQVNQAFADLADKMHEERTKASKQVAAGEDNDSGNYTSDAPREFSESITDIQKTCMMAVRALTRKNY